MITGRASIFFQTHKRIVANADTGKQGAGTIKTATEEVTSSRDWPAIAARVLAEETLTLRQASRLLLVGDGRHVATSTMRRWIVAGKRGVFLDGLYGAGKTWITSREALARFCGALSQRVAGVGSQSPVDDRNGDRLRRARAALAEFARLKGSA